MPDSGNWFQSMNLLILAVVALLFGGNSCTFSGHTQDKSSAFSNENDAIREAVFKYMFPNNESGMQGSVSVYCISISKDEQDPSIELLDRFTSHTPEVKPASGCYIKPIPGDPIGRIADKATENPGILFYVESISMKGNNRAVAEGGYVEGSLNAASSVYYLKKTKGKWAVTKKKLVSIA